MRKKKVLKNLSSLFPMTPRGEGMEMGCGESLPAPPGCSFLLSLSWHRSFLGLQEYLRSSWGAAWGGPLLWACSPSCPPPPPYPLFGVPLQLLPPWMPVAHHHHCSASLLLSVEFLAPSAQVTAPVSHNTLLAVCQGSHHHQVSPKQQIQSPVEIKNLKHPLVRKIWQSLLEGSGAC